MAKSNDVIETSIGSFGIWQALVCIIPIYCQFAVGSQQIATVFLVPETNFICINIENATDQCQSGCNEWKYDRSVFPHTIITEWELVCLKEFSVVLQQILLMFGIFMGNLIFGILSDRFGRRRPFLWANVIQLLAGISSAVAPWYWFFCFSRFLTGFGTGGTMLISFVIVMEIVGVEWRELTSMLFHIPFNLGHASLALISYYLRHWDDYLLAVSLQSAVQLLYYWGPESPRWLYATNHLEETVAVLEQAAKINRLPVNTIRSEVISYSRTFSHLHYTQEMEHAHFTDLFSRPNIRVKTICMGINWFATGFCYFGVATYVSFWGENIFLSVAYSALLALPGGVIAYFMYKCVGRKYTLLIGNIVSGFALLFITFLRKPQPIVVVSCAAIGLMALMISFSTSYLYVTELFPTVLRTKALGFCSMMTRIGSMLSPLIPYWIYYSETIPCIIYGIVPLLAAFVVVFLPETRDRPIPNSLVSSESFDSRRFSL